MSTGYSRPEATRAGDKGDGHISEAQKHVQHVQVPKWRAEQARAQKDTCKEQRIDKWLESRQREASAEELDSRIWNQIVGGRNKEAIHALEEPEQRFSSEQPSSLGRNSMLALPYFQHQMNETKQLKKDHMTSPRCGGGGLLIDNRKNTVRDKDTWESPN